MVVVVTEALTPVPEAALEIPPAPFLAFKPNPQPCERQTCNFIAARPETSGEMHNFMVGFPKSTLEMIIGS